MASKVCNIWASATRSRPEARSGAQQLAETLGKLPNMLSNLPKTNAGNAEAQAADRLAARLRELGIDPDHRPAMPPSFLLAPCRFASAGESKPFKGVTPAPPRAAPASRHQHDCRSAVCTFLAIMKISAPSALSPISRAVKPRWSRAKSSKSTAAGFRRPDRRQHRHQRRQPRLAGRCVVQSTFASEQFPLRPARLFHRQTQVVSRSLANDQSQMASRSMTTQPSTAPGIVPIYPMTEDLRPEALRRLMRPAVDHFASADHRRHARRCCASAIIPSLHAAFRNVHFPATLEAAKPPASVSSTKNSWCCRPLWHCAAATCATSKVRPGADLHRPDRCPHSPACAVHVDRRSGPGDCATFASTSPVNVRCSDCCKPTSVPAKPLSPSTPCWSPSPTSTRPR